MLSEATGEELTMEGFPRDPVFLDEVPSLDAAAGWVLRPGAPPPPARGCDYNSQQQK